MEIAFRLNGEERAADAAPTQSLLDWLRAQGLTGTKEGCNEGDCGACTVMLGDEAGVRAVNACLLMMPQVAGKAVVTVEGFGGDHPVQRAMVDHHGAQCGFCTPGFIVAMAAGHATGRRDHARVLAGNLCRCTGYAPILRAARAAEADPVPDRLAPMLVPLPAPADPDLPLDLEALAARLLARPEAPVVAGGTDVGLWVTKQLRDLPAPVFLHRVPELAAMTRAGGRLRIGAMVSVERLRLETGRSHPGLCALLSRFASDQIRAMATVGGNIANGSPIGDLPPALIALDARLGLRRGAARREIALEAFFLDYGRQDRAAGEFVEWVEIPDSAPGLVCDKLSKRFDQDISAVMMAADIRCEGGRVAGARLAFGGMAGVPKRARAAEAALLGAEWSAAGIAPAQAALGTDFAPLSDMRASAGYRLAAARGMLARLLAPAPLAALGPIGGADIDGGDIDGADISGEGAP